MNSNTYSDFLLKCSSLYSTLKGLSTHAKNIDEKSQMVPFHIADHIHVYVHSALMWLSKITVFLKEKTCLGMGKSNFVAQKKQRLLSFHIGIIRSL